MYPIDRRRVASHVYSLLNSLRQTAILLQVSHSTISRWIRNPNRSPYPRRTAIKSLQISETIRLAVINDPFISTRRLRHLIRDSLDLLVSRELVRVVIKREGMTRKKARFHGHPSCLEARTVAFVTERDRLLREGKQFVSLDETSFGRNGRPVYGYSIKGHPLYVKSKSPQTTTVSVLAAVTRDGNIKQSTKQGSFNTTSFLEAMRAFNLPRDTVILLDNVAFHRSSVVAEYARANSLHLLFVPPYSPWFNPIEGVFSIVKRRFYSRGCIQDAFAGVSGFHTAAFFDKSFTTSRGPDLLVMNGS